LTILHSFPYAVSPGADKHFLRVRAPGLKIQMTIR